MRTLRARRAATCGNKAGVDSLSYLVYGLPCVLLLVWHVMRRRRLERRSVQLYEQTRSAEPASLHPVINPGRCIGCG